ncbi:transporter substrate-binding domain-containing protein [Methylobacterium nodulans]|uniref:Extracellular solute-binding protein family 3 n=1 Tax=Methylobacterium nodulans (strain LMG 21967 / CNCM I-2342 / ORS 2060) TaxID=460265 RepID=B8IEA7_METNO|nr:transporter substrate-binding domain-containing protein [Methylobacterium nodulans]ACL59479.1 extracellular solute-binding protein family 3 [Methylobacterium nodulans ORS 2060]
MRRLMRAAAAAMMTLALTAALLPARAEELTGTLKKIKETGTIVIGYRESSVPFSYLDNDQKPIGFSMDLCGHVVEAVKKKLSLSDLKVAYNPVNSATRLPLVANGTVDLECGSTANQLARQKQVAFSVSTFVAQFKWLTRVDSGISSPDDLKGRNVVVTAGTNTAQFLNKLNQEQKLQLTITQGKDHAESFLLVETGRASAFMEDDILLAGVKANAKEPARFKILDKAYSADPYALMFRRDDPAFKAVVDETLIGLMKSGAFADLYAKWFESPIPPHGVNLAFPMSDKLKELTRNPSDKANS